MVFSMVFFMGRYTLTSASHQKHHRRSRAPGKEDSLIRGETPRAKSPPHHGARLSGVMPGAVGVRTSVLKELEGHSKLYCGSQLTCYSLVKISVSFRNLYKGPPKEESVSTRQYFRSLLCKGKYLRRLASNAGHSIITWSTVIVSPQCSHSGGEDPFIRYV